MDPLLQIRSAVEGEIRTAFRGVTSSMGVIGTLTGLYPKKDDSWNYHMHRYSLLNAPQKAAIARFLVELPKLVELDSEDQRTVERALRNYWGEYLPSSKSN